MHITAQLARHSRGRSPCEEPQPTVGRSFVRNRLLVLPTALTVCLWTTELAGATAPLDAINFADSMLNKLYAGATDPNVGPYPEEGFRIGGRDALFDYFNDVLEAMQGTEAEYCAAMDEFAPQFYFNDLSPNLAKDNWVRDFGRLEGKAGCVE